ncbi:MAG TPA: PBP1A family penicillin-binding protein, partial [Anaeromyxobacteraceae bacterium]|nr:PBP1A family penicillin-binding protein [Anaeromyxobacteraceae bacterium]
MKRLTRRRLLLWGLGLAALAVAVPALVLLRWTRELPAFDTLRDYRPLVSTRVLGAGGVEVFSFARERRTVVPLQEIPEVLRKAVLAAEDAKFYQHEGVNYLAILRCAAKGLLAGGVKCGGSTITQQVVKTFLLADEWRPKRKVKELVLAPRLEQNLGKDEILYLYLNQIYLGHRRYGVEEASRFYFGKPVKKLSLGEAAALAGLVQSPERLSPVKHPVAAKERQKYVLRRMAEEGFITKAQADAEAARAIVVAPPEPAPPGASYADAVRKYLDARYGAEKIETEGLTVEVAMDPALQRYAEAALEADLRAVDRRQGYRGPLAKLSKEQLDAALPAWRARLAEASLPRGALPVWDLGAVDPDEIEPGESAAGDARKLLRIRPLEAGEVYAALVRSVEDKQAVVDLGGATGTLPLADVAWARKWNPAAGTAAPKSVKAVVAPGDVVLVRVMPGAADPATLARGGRPLALSLEQKPQVQGALVALDAPTRQIRALVGGSGFVASQFNRATQARRQPGSAFKPFVWGAAVESRRFTPATLVYDTPDLYRDPWTGKEWKPRNFEKDEFDGPMLLKAALAESKNTVSVKLTDALGVDAVIAFARRMGIESDLPRNLTLALGTGEVTPLELTNAYATIAARGQLAPPVMVLRVKDRDGTVLEEWKPGAPGQFGQAASAQAAPSPQPSPPVGEREKSAVPAPPGGEREPSAGAPPDFVLPATGTRPDVAYVLSSMMRDVVEYGTGAAAKALGRPTAAKTGTAQEHRDAWFVGFTPELVAGVWVGFDDHAPLGPRETGAGAALPAWLAFMQSAVGARPPVEFQAPEGVELARIDPTSGLLAGEPRAGEPEAPFVPFLTGTAPTESAS